MKRRQFIGAAAALSITALTPRRLKAWDGGGLIPTPGLGGGSRSPIRLLTTMAMMLLILGTFTNMLNAFILFGSTAHRVFLAIHRQWVSVFRLTEVYLTAVLVLATLLSTLTQNPVRRRDPAYREAKKIADTNKRLGTQAQRHALNYERMAETSWGRVDLFNTGTRDAKAWATAQRNEARSVGRQHGSSVTRDERREYEDDAKGMAAGYNRELNMYRLDFTEHNRNMRALADSVSRRINQDIDYGRRLAAELKTTHNLTLRLTYDRYDRDEGYRENTLNGLRESGARSQSLWGMRQANWRDITTETRQLDRILNEARRDANSAAGKTQRWGLRVGVSYKF